MVDAKPRSSMRTLLLWAGAACAVLFLLSGLVAGGPAGVLLALGIMVLLLGVGALAFGRARWARIGGRRTAGLVAAAGLVVTVAAGAMLPAPRTTTAAPAPPAPSSAPASLAADDAAIQTAEDSLADAEAAATSAQANVSSGSLLGDSAADSRVTSAAATAPSSALAALAAIPVKGRAPMTGYSRDQFGNGWVDTDRNGCDTRNDVLARDLTGDTFKPGTHDCVVLTGTLADPYSGRTIAFQRGASTSTAVQIDHVVALSDAWQTGAQQLGRREAHRLRQRPAEPAGRRRPAERAEGRRRRRDLAAAEQGLPVRVRRAAGRGEGHLRAVDDPGREGRQRHDPRHLPDDDAAGRRRRGAAADRRRDAGADDPPDDDGAPHHHGSSPDDNEGAAPATTPAPRPSAAPPAGDVYYANCSAVRAAGKAPIYRGQPGYSSKLDRDGDGIGCE